MNAETPTGSVRGKYHAIGKYEILAHVATGGMGAVYRAVNSETGEEVALKVLSPALATQGGTALERFRREGRVQLRHENIVAIYEIGEANSIHYLALEFVDGIDLHEYSNRKGPLDPDEARLLLTQAARALDYLHRHQMIHRDVKPSNFLLSYRGEEPVIKLTDMGLARDVNDNDARVTRAGNTVGTIDYMAPEQARDSSFADIRSDIYSLGCTFYHLLAAQPPFPEGGLAEKLYKHAEANPPDIRQFNPRAGGGVVKVLERMMAKRPQDRYQTPAELLDDLARIERGEPLLSLTAGIPNGGLGSFDSSGRDSKHPIGLGDESLVTGRRRAAEQQFERAQQIVAGANGDYGLALLLSCCKLDPGNLSYRQALRHAQKAKHDNRWSWLNLLLAKAAQKVARSAGRHDKVLEYGEKALTANPWDIGAQLDMAAAAEALNLPHLALWVLEQAWSKASQTPILNRALAGQYEKRGLYNEAAKLWKLILREEPGDIEAHRKVNDLAAKETIARGLYEEMVESRTGRERS